MSAHSELQQDGRGEYLTGGGLRLHLGLVHAPAPHRHPHRRHGVQRPEDGVRGGGGQDAALPAVQVLAPAPGDEGAPVVGVNLDQLLRGARLVLGLGLVRTFYRLCQSTINKK